MLSFPNMPTIFSGLGADERIFTGFNTAAIVVISRTR